MSTFVLPDLGEGLQEAEIVSWHVAEGEHVVLDQPLLAVETEKAVVEIPSPKAGHIGKLLAKVGERVKVGAPVVEFEEGPHAESGTVMGQLAGEATAMPVSPAGATAAPKASIRSAPIAPSVRASPAVRSRARELAVDLSAITPTGPDNTITLADVQAAAPNSGTKQSVEALRGARRTMATNMAKAWREVVHATVQDDADVDAWAPTEDVTSRLVRALIAGCKTEPGLNASFDAATLSLRANGTIDLGIAIDSPEGLFVPVLRDVARGTPQDWRRQIETFKRGVQDRSLTPADLHGATISLSNFGLIAGRHASLIVMPPQVAILGVGRITMQPVQAGETVALHRAMPLSLTFDHRAVTGGMAARFLRAMIADLESAA
jgi:pyruvate dehydrogenase E2 component (dihydrolipoamide acetyltransferase)